MLCYICMRNISQQFPHTNFGHDFQTLNISNTHGIDIKDILKL